MVSKRIERAYLELARSVCDEFPSGDPHESESPDFLWRDGLLGIEVRRLFQPASPTGFPPPEIEGFRQKVVRQAEKFYQDAGGLPAVVIVNFSNRSDHQQSANDLARAIADFVRANRHGEKQVTYYDGGNLDIPVPSGLNGINIASPLPGPRRPWFASGVGQTILVTFTLLQQAIKEKDALIASYRTKASEVWLLIVCDLFPASMSFAVPDDISEWEFAFEFDKVLLLSCADMKVWSLRRAPSCRLASGSALSRESRMKAEPNPPP
jgi:hypothetical protein